MRASWSSARKADRPGRRRSGISDAAFQAFAAIAAQIARRCCFWTGLCSWPCSTAPPASPAEGDRHLVASGAIGLWAGWDQSIALRADGTWLRLLPRPGWRAMVCCWTSMARVGSAPLRVFRCQSRPNQMAIQTISGINKNNGLGGGEGWISDPSPPSIGEPTFLPRRGRLSSLTMGSLGRTEPDLVVHSVS